VVILSSPIRKKNLISSETHPSEKNHKLFLLRTESKNRKTKKNTKQKMAAAAEESKHDDVQRNDEAEEGEKAGKGKAPMNLDAVDMTGDIDLVSKEDKRFLVPKLHAVISTLVKTALATDPTATEVHLPGVSSVALQEVVIYIQHHKGVEPKLVEKPLK
jgi:hypothetical protein